MKISDIDIFVHGRNAQPENVEINTTLTREEYTWLVNEIKNVIGRCKQSLSNPDVGEKKRIKRQKLYDCTTSLLEKITPKE